MDLRHVGRKLTRRTQLDHSQCWVIRSTVCGVHKTQNSSRCAFQDAIQVCQVRTWIPLLNVQVRSLCGNRRIKLRFGLSSSRRTLSPLAMAARDPFYLVRDEIQDYVSASVSSIWLRYWFHTSSLWATRRSCIVVLHSTSICHTDHTGLFMLGDLIFIRFLTSGIQDTRNFRSIWETACQ